MRTLDELLDADPTLTIGVSNKSLVQLLERLKILQRDDPDKGFMRMEREAMMVEGGLRPLTAHRWMDLNPDMYGDIKTAEALNEQR